MNTYELWKTSVQLAEGATTEAERAHHRAIADVLRADAIKSYFSHIAAALAEYPDGIDTPDNEQVSEFFRDLDALRTPPQDELDKRTDDMLTRVLNSLKAMEHLNYTGEHTHFEVLTDARQVLAEVMRGRAIPQLERFRCPSLLQIASDPSDPVQTVRCKLPLPHEGKHVAELGQTWTDAGSANPPKSYDVPKCAVYQCAQPPNHNGPCRTEDGKQVPF